MACVPIQRPVLSQEHHLWGHALGPVSNEDRADGQSTADCR